MAGEKINIATLELDTEQLIRETQLTKKSIDQLKEAQKILRKEGDTSSKQFIDNAATLKKLNSEYGRNIKTISVLADENGKLIKAEQALNKELDKEIKGVDQARANNAELLKIRNSLNLSTEKGIKARDEINKKLDQNNKFIKENVSGLEQQKIGIGGYEEGVVNALRSQRLFGVSIGDTAEKLILKRNAMAASAQATNGGTKALKLFKVALASTGIGLLLIALGSLVAFFKSSEEGQASFNKILRVTGVIIGNISDLFADFGEVILNAFRNPKQAWEDFTNSLRRGWEFIKKQVFDRFSGTFMILVAGIQRGVAEIQLAWAKLTGNDSKIKKAEEAIESANQKAVEGARKIVAANREVADAYDRVTTSVKGFIEETKKEISEAQRLADLELETNRLERKALVERAKAEAVIADLRLKAKKEDEFSSKQRLAFLREAGELQDSLAAQDEEIARNRLELRKIENTFSKSTRENLEEEARLEAEVYRVEAARLNQRRTIEREIQRTRRQAEAEQSKREKEADARRQERLIRELEDAEAQLLLEEEIARQETELLKEQLEEEAQLKKELADLDILRKAEQRQFNRDQEEIEFEAKMLRLEEQGAREYEFRQSQIEREKELAIQRAEEEIKNKDQLESALQNIETNYRLKTAALTTQVEIEKAKSIAAIARGLSVLFDEQSAAGKVAAISEATINTYLAATEALGNPIKFAAVISSGLATVAKISGIDTGGEFQAVGAIAGNLANLNNLSLPKAEKGAAFVIGGNRHSAGGTRFSGTDGTQFEAERGEILAVMSREASQHFMAFNDRYTNGSGYVPNFFRNGGIVERGVASNVSSQENEELQRAVYEGALKGTMEGSKTGVSEAIEESELANDAVI